MHFSVEQLVRVCWLWQAELIQDAREKLVHFARVQRGAFTGEDADGLAIDTCFDGSVGPSHQLLRSAVSAPPSTSPGEEHDQLRSETRHYSASTPMDVRWSSASAAGRQPWSWSEPLGIETPPAAGTHPFVRATGRVAGHAGGRVVGHVGAVRVAPGYQR